MDNSFEICTSPQLFSIMATTEVCSTASLSAFESDSPFPIPTDTGQAETWTELLKRHCVYPRPVYWWEKIGENCCQVLITKADKDTPTHACRNSHKYRARHDNLCCRLVYYHRFRSPFWLMEAKLKEVARLLPFNLSKLLWAYPCIPEVD